MIANDDDCARSVSLSHTELHDSTLLETVQYGNEMFYR